MDYNTLLDGVESRTKALNFMLLNAAMKMLKHFKFVNSFAQLLLPIISQELIIFS